MPIGGSGGEVDGGDDQPFSSLGVEEVIILGVAGVGVIILAIQLRVDTCRPTSSRRGVVSVVGRSPKGNDVVSSTCAPPDQFQPPQYGGNTLNQDALSRARDSRGGGRDMVRDTKDIELHGQGDMQTTPV